MKSSVFSLEKPKKFNYKPRFYNAQKDELEQRIKAHKLSKEQTEEERVKIRIRSNWDRQREKQKPKKQSWTRLLVMMALVGLIIYIIMR